MAPSGEEEEGEVSQDQICSAFAPSVFSCLREGVRKKNRIFYGLLSARVVKKPYCFFEKYFFQRACRIILGPPKHVLHLVWSPFVIYIAIRTALKVALYDFLDGPPAPLNSQLMEKVNHYNCTKK